ncbi:MAG: polyvinylalcohol dehydrogenase, partial [Planctomycetaceae bacterium]|nr:polyvinylalcohol dehydrogenase [Planctomycetaceae bacterium]
MRKFLPFSSLMLVLIAASVLTADDWPQWRGPNRDAISQETGLLKSWPADGPPLAWKVDGVGNG